MTWLTWLGIGSLAVMLLLAGLWEYGKKRSRWMGELDRQLTASFGRDESLFLIVGASALMLLLIGRVFARLGAVLGFHALAAAGQVCSGIGFVDGFTLAWIFFKKSEREEIRELFGPKIMQNNKNFNFNHFNAVNAAFGNEGTVHQQARIGSFSMYQQIHALMDMAKNETALDDASKSEMNEELTTLAHEMTKAPESRDASRMSRAVERISQLAALAKPLLEAWNAIYGAIQPYV